MCSRRGGWLGGRIEGELLSAGEDFMGAGLLPANAHQVKIMLVMRHHGVHLINITLTTNTVPIQDVHRGSKPGHSFSQGVVLGGLPGSHEGIMSRRQSLLGRGHPPVDCSLEGQSGILLNVFRMVQQICLQTFSNRPVVVVPEVTQHNTSYPAYS